MKKKKEIFYKKVINELPVFLSYFHKVQSKKSVQIDENRIASFACYESKESFCFGPNKPISKLIENENETKIL